MNNIIEFKNVSYLYPNSQQPALKELDLTVEKGTFVAVLGHTGAGKTTLSLCLNGLIPKLMEGQLTGDITIEGKDLNKATIQEMAGIIGLVLDDPEAQVFGRTVLEDASFGPINLSLTELEIYQRVEKALAMVRLQGYEGRDTAQLSGGEKQRLAIAGILAMEPEIIAMDEPTSELDPQGIRDIYETIDQLRQEQERTLIVTEHDSTQIIERADLVVVLNQGELAWQGAPADLFRNIPKLLEYGIKPVPLSLLGWDLYQKGLIDYDQIPLDVPSAERVIRNLPPKAIEYTLAKLAPKQKVNLESQDIIRISELNFSYDSGQVALQDINLTIARGEFVALIGRNGSGKTTLAKHLNGLLTPTSGVVLVDGLNTAKVGTSTLFKKVGYVFQNPDHQIFSISVEKELEYGLKNAGFDDNEIKRRVDRALEFTELTEQRHDHPLTLGKGKRQMIALASILVLEPKILVIDEPTTGLDWNDSQRILNIIQQLHQQGTTIIMISHDMEVVAKLAQRAIVMAGGQILLEGNMEEVFQDSEKLEAAGIVPPQYFQLISRLNYEGPEMAWEDTACF